MTHFATRYIGTPWRRYGRSMAGFDCWGLVIWVLKEHYGIVVEDAIADGSKTSERVRAFIEYEKTQMADWISVDYPMDGDIVVMGNRNAVPTHCGIYIQVDQNTSGVLHCEEEIGCVFERASNIRWPSLRFYRHKQ